MVWYAHVGPHAASSYPPPRSCLPFPSTNLRPPYIRPSSPHIIMKDSCWDQALGTFKANEPFRNLSEFKGKRFTVDISIFLDKFLRSDVDKLASNGIDGRNKRNKKENHDPTKGNPSSLEHILLGKKRYIGPVRAMNSSKFWGNLLLEYWYEIGVPLQADGGGHINRMRRLCKFACAECLDFADRR